MRVLATLGFCGCSVVAVTMLGCLADFGFAEDWDGTASDSQSATDTTDGLCGGRVCNEPPADECIDEIALMAYDPIGTCNNGECSYSTSNVGCEFGCAAGACLECDVGPCCGLQGRFLGPKVRCNEVPFSQEYGCRADECASDVRWRDLFQHCTGTDAQCGSLNLVPGAWTVSETCDSNSMCRSDLTNGWCEECLFGCGDNGCEPDPCALVICATPNEDYCLGEDTLRDYESVGQCSNGICSYDYLDVFCSTGCETLSGNDRCRANPCDGVVCDKVPDDVCFLASDEPWERVYSGSGTCSNGVCTYPYVVTKCGALGCDFTVGHCIQPECSTGPCCDAGYFKAVGTVCDTQAEYSCESTDCGADGLARTVTRACTGASATCDGAPQYSAFTTIAFCAANALCTANASGASCTDCLSGCLDGACL